MSKLTKKQIKFGKNKLEMMNLAEEYIPLPAPDENGFSDAFYRVAHGFDISGYSRKQLDILSNNGYHLIHIATIFKNIKALKYLINLKIDTKIPAPKLSGRHAIHLATKNGDKEIVEILIENGANIDATDNDGNQPIHTAAYNGHKEIIEILLKNGANIHATDNDGDQPIHDAALMGHKELVELLLQKGANIHAATEGKMQPIHLAALQGHKEVLELLIENGADIHAVNDRGKRPINIATINGYEELVELLIKEYKKSKKENELTTLLTSNNFTFFKALFSVHSTFNITNKKLQERVFPAFAKLYKFLDDKQKIALEETFKDKEYFEFFKEALNISRKKTIDIENVVSLMIVLCKSRITYPEMKKIITKKTGDIYFKLKATTQDADKLIDYESLELAAKLSLTAKLINTLGYPNEIINHIFAYITGNDAINYTEALNINHPIQVISVNDIEAPDQTPDIAITAAKNQKFIE